MTIELSTDAARIIDEQVRAGRFSSPAEAVDAAVGRLQAEDDACEIEELRALVDVGLAELDRGELVEFNAEDIIAEQRAAWDRRHGRT